MLGTQLGDTLLNAASCADTVGAVFAGAIVGSFATVIINRLRVRQRIDRLIARYRQQCRPLRDDEEIDFDYCLQQTTVQVLERVKAEIAPQ